MAKRGRSARAGNAARPCAAKASASRIAAPAASRHALRPSGVNPPGRNAMSPKIGMSPKHTCAPASARWAVTIGDRGAAEVAVGTIAKITGRAPAGSRRLLRVRHLRHDVHLPQCVLILTEQRLDAVELLLH